MEAGGTGCGWSGGQPRDIRVVVGRLAEGVGGVADRPVTGAATQVARQGVQVEAVGSVLMVRRGAGVVRRVALRGVGRGLVAVLRRVRSRGAARAATLSVVLGGHAADEAG